MTKIITDIFMYLFEFLLFWYYSDSLFDAKKDTSKRVSLMLLNTVFLGVIYQLNITYINAILMFVTYVLLLLYLYNISLKTAVFHSLIFMVVMLASEILVMAISSVLYKGFNAFESSPSAYLVMIPTSKLIYFSLMIIILKLFAQKEKNEQYNKYFWLLFIMPLTSIMVLVCFRYIAYQMQLTKVMSILWIISCIGLLFANILVFIIYEYSLKNTKELYELKAIQDREEQDKRYFEIIEQSNKDMRIFSHDIKNHLTQIRNLENIEAVQSYINSIYPNIEKFSFTGISKNKMLDLIISKYVTLCEKKNIKFSVDVKTANLAYVSDSDLSTLMNNLLDNAVEAAERADERFIQVYIFSKGNMHDGLVIKNSCAISPKAENGELKTTKQNKKTHGVGTKSIRKTLKKYDAVYGWKYDENSKIFETDIVFPKKNCFVQATNSLQNKVVL